MKISTVMGNSQRLDGGAMFGNAPRALWSRWIEVDEEHRVALCCRGLLVEEGARKILFETGIGAFFPPEMKERYGVVEEKHVLLDSLETIGVSPDEITDVVLSHLHFDHAGGLLTEFQVGMRSQLLFSNARYLVGEAAFHRAKNPHMRDRASFIPELQSLLENSGRLVLVHEKNANEVDPLVRFRFSDGHTPGMMISEVQGESGTLFFVGDLIPGLPWVHQPITMGYDRFAERLIEEKGMLLNELVEKNAFLFFTHDPKAALVRVSKSIKGKYEPIDIQIEFTRLSF